MAISESAVKLKAMIEKAIDDHKLTRSEYDAIIALATEDSIIDAHEKALLSELQDMIEDKTIRVVP